MTATSAQGGRGPTPGWIAPSVADRLSGYFADLEQVTVWIPKERAYLIAVVHRRCEELRPALPEHLVAPAAVRHPKDQLRTHPVSINRWRESHGRLVVGRSTPSDQQQPAAEQP